MFPSFSASDINGATISSTDFRNNYTYVQIGALSIKGDQILIKKIESEYGKDLNILVFTDNPSIPEEWKENLNVKIVLRNSSSTQALFSTPGIGSYFLFYDPNGRLVRAGNTQAGFERGIKSLLDLYVRGKSFKPELFIPKIGGRVEEYSWLRQLGELISNYPYEYSLFGFFSSICDSCSSGLMISIMKSIRAQADSGLGVWCIVSPEFTQVDVDALSSQLSLNFPVSIADHQLGNKWQELGKAYTINDISEIIMMVNRGGEVIDVFNRFDIKSKDEFVFRCMKLSTGR